MSRVGLAQAGVRGLRAAGAALNDKYLPVWVILAMTTSVLMLSCQMTAATREVCAAKGGCGNEAGASKGAASAASSSSLANAAAAATNAAAPAAVAASR